MLETLQQLDHEVFMYLNHLGSPTWDWLWLVITNKWAWIPFYFVLMLLLLKKIKLKATIISMILIFLMILCTDQLANLVKHTVMRPRPCHLPDARVVARCGTFGFFSAHASSSMALAIFIGLILKPYYRFALLGMIVWSLVVSYSRIYVGVHYPGDVLVGLVVGLIIGFIFYWLFRYFSRKFPSKDTVRQIT